MVEETKDTRKQEVFLFLDDLRESGAVNMFASPSVLQEQFSLTKKESRDLFLEWAKTFGERHG